MKLSIIIPVYNERNTVEKIVSQIRAVAVEKELLLVDDGSTDGTREVIRRVFSGQPDIKAIFHEINQGKGAAVRSGIGAATGEAIIIQDADLEYDPADYLVLLKALDEPGVNIVYGSRFLNHAKVTPHWHWFINYFLTLLTNLLFFSSLTDMETCYKLYRAKVLKNLGLVSNGFEIEVELTAKTLRRGEKIVEVPISYKGRSFHEGKKIGWRDGVKAVFMLFRYRCLP